MGRVLAIDLGTKRTGLAVTDILKITANPLETIRTMDLDKYLKDYVQKEPVEAIVVGYPKSMDGSDTNMTQPAIRLKDR